MSTPPQAQQQPPPHGSGSALSVGLVLVMWGAFLYFYPPAANLPAWVQTLALFLAFACFILGAITAGAGISDLRQSQFMSHFGISVALAVIAYALFCLSDRLADQPQLSMASRIAVVPAALAAMFMFGLGISDLLTARPHEQGNQQAHLSEPSTGPPAARFERIASAMIAFVSLAAAIVALINEVRRGR
ncbi:MAG: hypothetical protein ACRDJC_16945 [Thermomicrobiales bacterium]